MLKELPSLLPVAEELVKTLIGQIEAREIGLKEAEERIVEAVRRKSKVQQRHVASLGPYDAGVSQRHRALVADWSPWSVRRWCSRSLQRIPDGFKEEATCGSSGDGESG